jgi:hypothetical protein
LGGWWPFALAIADALLAAVIIVALALTMVIGVQLLNALRASHFGNKANFLALDKVFDGIASNQTVPEYWWIYALLFSTLIPR